MIRFAHYAVGSRYPHPWVAISNFVPAWFRYDEYIKALAPDWDDVRSARSEMITKQEFTARYWAKISMLWDSRPDVILTMDANDATCFCYEKPGEFCHRRILAAFLVRKGFKVELDGKPIDESFRILNCTAGCCGKQLSDCDCVPF